MKPLLPETLASKCHEWLPTSARRSAIAWTVWGVCMSQINDASSPATFIKQPLHMLLLRVVPADTEESYCAGGPALIKWLPRVPLIFTSSLGLIVNRSWMLSDLLWGWYELSALPRLTSAPRPSVICNGFQMCSSCSQTLANIHRTSGPCWRRSWWKQPLKLKEVDGLL